jgi:hypothetical protein
VITTGTASRPVPPVLACRDAGVAVAGGQRWHPRHVDALRPARHAGARHADRPAQQPAARRRTGDRPRDRDLKRRSRVRLCRLRPRDLAAGPISCSCARTTYRRRSSHDRCGSWWSPAAPWWRGKGCSFPLLTIVGSTTGA